jgi:alkanesulfonate monooxygenase SsuD/methylene tetrahydromethanopterin reductase-like flavin-dependent oxidoreductase (luciferase family)
MAWETEEPVSHAGRFFNIPPRSVIPKPVQQPHPPLWMAASQPDSFAQAGEEVGIDQVLCSM